MTTPFQNDPFAMLYQAFKTLFPDKDCISSWHPELTDEHGESVCGVTTFADDGNVYVDISGELQVSNAIEIFAHELAHVAAGDAAQHGPEWDKAFDAIFDEYERMCNQST